MISSLAPGADTAARTGELIPNHTVLGASQRPVGSPLGARRAALGLAQQAREAGERPREEDARMRLGDAEPLADLGMRQSLDVGQRDHLSIVVRQVLEHPLQPLELLAQHCGLARPAERLVELEKARGIARGLRSDRHLAPRIPLLREVVAMAVLDLAERRGVEPLPEAVLAVVLQPIDVLQHFTAR